ncbi:MAG: LysR family transcriptional regulator [Gammaproteobacteria bacterium]
MTLMNPHRKPYRLLVAVAEERSFSGAARRLNLALPTHLGRERVEQTRRVVDAADRFQSMIDAPRPDELPIHSGYVAKLWSCA